MVCFRSKLLAAICATGFSLGIGLTSSANAATVDCPTSGISITTVSASCMAFGPGSMDTSAFLNGLLAGLGYVLLDKSDDLISGALPGSLTTTPPTSGITGSFLVVAPGYTSLVLGLERRSDQLDLNWATFVLGALSGTWDILVVQQQLSHANLYGIRGAAIDPVPLPAPFILMGTVLAGTYLVGRWRRRRVPTSAA